MCSFVASSSFSWGLVCIKGHVGCPQPFSIPWQHWIFQLLKASVCVLFVCLVMYRKKNLPILVEQWSLVSPTDPPKWFLSTGTSPLSSLTCSCCFPTWSWMTIQYTASCFTGGDRCFRSVDVLEYTTSCSVCGDEDSCTVDVLFFRRQRTTTTTRAVRARLVNRIRINPSNKTYIWLLRITWIISSICSLSRGVRCSRHLHIAIKMKMICTLTWISIIFDITVSRLMHISLGTILLIPKISQICLQYYLYVIHKQRVLLTKVLK